MINAHATQSHNISYPTKKRQLCSLGYECVTTVTLAFTIAFITTAIVGSAEPLILRSIVGFTTLCGIWAYYILCWTTSGQSLAQKSWGLKTVIHSETLLTVKAASIRLALATAFNLTLIGPVAMLIIKDNQLPQDKLLNTQVISIDRSH